MVRLLLTVSVLSFAALLHAEPAKPPPFFAMDTALRQTPMTPAQQFDLVKELGYTGVAWHEESPETARANVDELAKRGLKMHAIYCPATVAPDGGLTTSSQLPKLIEALKGSGTIIWLHIGGKGPEIGKLTGNEPAVTKLRDIADLAAGGDLQVAIYPHLGEWTAHFSDATTLAKLVNKKNFGVTFNLCHALAVGDEAKIPAMLEEAKDVLKIVTINGADAGLTGGKWDKLIQPLDRGTYDVGIVVKKLKQIGFTGPIGFQGYNVKGSSREILTATMQGWTRLHQ